MRPFATTVPTYHFRAAVVLAALAGGLALAGCDDDPPASLYDPAGQSGGKPVLSAILPAPSTNPADYALAGVTTLTLTGQNFSSTPANNAVYFDALEGEVLTASPTQLTVKPPAIVKDSIRVKVAVLRAPEFSETMFYRLYPASAEYARLDTNRKPQGIDVGPSGDLFVSNFNSAGLAVARVVNDTLSSTLYSPVLASSARFYNVIRFGPSGELYGFIRRDIVYRIPAGGGAAAVFAARGQLGNMYDCDFDPSGTMWACGTIADTGTAAYRVRIGPPVDVKRLSLKGLMRSLRYYQNSLYFAGRRDTVEGVWRTPVVSADSIGAPVLVYNLTANYAGARANAVTLTADGTILLGTDAAPTILKVSQAGVAEPLYPGLFSPGINTFTYGTGVYLFATREVPNSGGQSQVLRINMQRPGAP